MKIERPNLPERRRGTITTYPRIADPPKYHWLSWEGVDANEYIKAKLKELRKDQ